jgi:hypothetical protein
MASDARDSDTGVPPAPAEERAEPVPPAAAPVPPTVVLPPATPAEPSGDEPTRPHQPATLGPVPAAGRFGRYELLGEVNWGGMGIVYKAQDTLLGRVVALKMLKSGALAHADEVERFYREARAVARLRHPHIVSVYDFGQHEGLHYFTMEYVGGGTLAQHFRRFRADVRAAVSLVAKVARAVHYAHEQGIVHRDLKPGNILLDDQGEPRVSDLGLAKFLDAAVGETPPAGGTAELVLGQPSPSSDEVWTRTAGVLGTPAYMSPEQVDGRKATPASDIWALGVLLYELLTGRHPSPGRSPEELLHNIRTAEPVALHDLRPDLDPALEAVCLGCLEKDPQRRPASAQALAEALQTWLEGRVQSRQAPAWRRSLLWATVLVLLAGLGVAVGVAVFRPGAERPLRDHQRRLARSEEVRLLGDKGAPAWFRWSLGQTALREAPEAGDALCLDSSTPCLMELLPTLPGSGYQLRAEVRHEYSALGEVGLAFAHTRQVTAADADDYFCLLTFNDKERLITPINREPCSQVALYVVWHGASEGQKAALAFSKYITPGPAVRGGPAPWRKLAVRVTPEKIEAFWEDEPFGAVSRQDLVPLLRRLKRFQPQSDDFPLTLPTFPHQGGVGLYVTGGSASFRGVVVTPAP